MKKILPLLFIPLIFSCRDNEVDPQPEPDECTIEATLVDLSGLDGCGFVFELKGGKRLLPVPFFYCGTPPLPKEAVEDPLQNFEFTNGKKVMLEYEPYEGYMDACMAGETVKITCLTEVGIQDDDESQE